MDLALLGNASRSAVSGDRRIRLATAAVIGITVLDVLTSMQKSQ